MDFTKEFGLKPISPVKIPFGDLLVFQILSLFQGGPALPETKVFDVLLSMEKAAPLEYVMPFSGDWSRAQLFCAPLPKKKTGFPGRRARFSHVRRESFMDFGNSGATRSNKCLTRVLGVGLQVDCPEGRGGLPEGD